MKTVTDADFFVYPITILMDRYGGSYSRAKWTAWNLDADEIPSGAQGGDTECWDFWDAYRDRLPLGRTSQDRTPPWEHIIGFGATPDEAASDLRAQVAAKKAAK